MKKLAFVLCALTMVSCGGGDDTPPPPSVTIAVSPSAATVPAGGTQQFTATVANTSNTAVTWQVDGTSGGNSTKGTISSTGLYTAPEVPPVGQTVTVTAVAQADTSKTASATVTITFSNASLNGRYAFLFAGSDSLGSFFAAGAFQADGNGNLLNGVEDLNHDVGVTPNLLFTGTYSVQADGRGTATITSSQGTSTLHFVVVSGDAVRLIAFDSTDSGNGLALRQDPTAFANSALNGTYVFGLDGIGPNAFLASVTGLFTADGAQNISDGMDDINEGGVVSTEFFTGAYNISSNGRGTAALTSPSGTNVFAFYMVSADQIFIVSLDFIPAFVGSALKQDNVAFSNASLSGDFAFRQSGFTTLGGFVSAGRLTANGGGLINQGVFDGNEAGTVAENVSFTGSYNVAPTGRGTGSLTGAFGTSNFIFYLVSSNRSFFIGTRPDAVNSGLLLSQQAGPLSNATLSGRYAVSVSGFTRAAGSFGSVGRLDADGQGQLSGVQDTNDGGTLSTAVSLTGTYTVSSNGRGAATVTPSGGTTTNLRFYVVDGALVLAVGADADAFLVGVLERQF